MLEEAKYKAVTLRQATGNAKKVAVETEELKEQADVFPSAPQVYIEESVAIVESSDWEDILLAQQLLTFRQVMKPLKVVGEVLGESVSLQPEEEPIDMTRRVPEEVAEFESRIRLATEN